MHGASRGAEEVARNWATARGRGCAYVGGGARAIELSAIAGVLDVGAMARVFHLHY